MASSFEVSGGRCWFSSELRDVFALFCELRDELCWAEALSVLVLITLTHFVRLDGGKKLAIHENGQITCRCLYLHHNSSDVTS